MRLSIVCGSISSSSSSSSPPSSAPSASFRRWPGASSWERLSSAPASPSSSSANRSAFCRALSASSASASASAAPAHFSASAAAAARGLRGVATGLAPRHCSRFSLALEAASGGDPPAAVPLRASVLASSTSPRVLEKRPRPGNGASRFQRLSSEVLIEFCVSSMRNYRLIFCHNLKQP